MRTDRLRALRSAVGYSEVALWPTCAKCTDATSALGPEFERWIPVEGYSVDPEVFRRYDLIGPRGGSVELANLLNQPRKLRTRGWFTVIARCHGREAAAEIDVPDTWGVYAVRAAIQSLAFFGADARPDVNLRLVTS